MAEKRDRKERNEKPDLDDDVKDIGEGDDEEFEDVETEDEDIDEDVLDEEAAGQDAHYTAEIGSEGGSAGDLQERRAQSGIARGSEATETGQPSSQVERATNRK